MLPRMLPGDGPPARCDCARCDPHWALLRRNAFVERIAVWVADPDHPLRVMAARPRSTRMIRQTAVGEACLSMTGNLRKRSGWVIFAGGLRTQSESFDP